MASNDLRRIGAALAAFWSGGLGPPRSAIQRAFTVAGHDGEGFETGNKEQFVLNLIARAEDPLARRMIEELVAVLSEAEAFTGDRSPVRVVEGLRRSFSEADHQLSDAGTIQWASAVADTVRRGAPRPTAATHTQEAPQASVPAARTETRMPTVPRSKLFIGSTVEALPLARAVHAELDHDLEVTIWNHGLFSPGVTTWAQLATITRSYDFAVFVFSGDDEIRSRGEDSLAVRDNLLIEYGLFVGVLGADRTFFLYNRNHRPKIASDLGGVTPLTYGDREDQNLRAAVSPACDELRNVVRRLGRASHTP